MSRCIESVTAIELQFIGALAIARIDEQIESSSSARVSVAIDACCKRGSLKGHGRNCVLIECIENGDQLRSIGHLVEGVVLIFRLEAFSNLTWLWCVGSGEPRDGQQHYTMLFRGAKQCIPIANVLRQGADLRI
jgi:hypothetical protein